MWWKILIGANAVGSLIAYLLVYGGTKKGKGVKPATRKKAIRKEPS